MVPLVSMMGLGDSVVVWIAIGYAIGSIPTGVALARIRGIDLRRVGSGNIGATNAMRALGPKLGLVVFVLDVLKAAIPVWLASQPWALGSAASPEVAAVGFAAVVGHIFPAYLGFRGGKGVACGLGIFLALDPPVALAAVVIYGQGLFLTRTSAVGSLNAVSAIALFEIIGHKPIAHQILAVACAVLIWLRHGSNIRRLIADARARRNQDQGAGRPSGSSS